MDNNSQQPGGNCSILLGLTYLIGGLAYLKLPLSQKIQGSDFLLSYAKEPNPALIQTLALTVGALLALAVVPMISQKVRAQPGGWIGWTNNLALLGFGVLIIDNLRLLALRPTQALVYAQGDAITRRALELNGPFSLDPDGWLKFGAIGLWVLVVSTVSLRRKVFPEFLSYIGVFLGLTYWMMMMGIILKAPGVLNNAAIVGGIVLAPVWFIGIGYQTRKPPSSPPESGHL